MNTNRLNRQLNFIVQTDQLKHVLRQTYLIHDQRHENSAEHSWQIALMALTLVEFSLEPIDILRVIQMLLLHDLVEIDAGDTYCYDAAANQEKSLREEDAAKRIFGLLPDEQAEEYHNLWREFERRSTSEARFAAALDRLMPILHNFYTQGKSWQEHGITVEQVLTRNQHIAEGAPRLWQFVQELIDEAVTRGYLKE